MKDLDFDELDRAVNSLMGDVPKTAPASKPDDDTPALTISPTLGAHETPDFSKLAETTERAEPTVPAPRPSELATPEEAAPVPTASVTPATRRGGRFMDVVHPSSDMKKVNAPARPVSRQGVTVEPRMPVAAPEVAEHEASAEPPQPSTPNVQPAEHPAQANDWPDPLDMAGYEKEPETAVPDDVKAPNATPTTMVGEEPSAPLTSPFLTDAKVEKRPLGGAAPTSDKAEEPDHTPVVDTLLSQGLSKDDPKAQLPPEPAAETPLPEEYQSSLVAIESGSHMLESGMESEPATVAQPAAPTTPAKPAAQEPVSAGPTSIPQQYKEEAGTGEQENGAIYDTQNYHQPLAHPEKKKSGWMLVVWIVLVILVGVGAGAAVFMLGIM